MTISTRAGQLGPQPVGVVSFSQPGDPLGRGGEQKPGTAWQTRAPRPIAICVLPVPLKKGDRPQHLRAVVAVRGTGSSIVGFPFQVGG